MLFLGSTTTNIGKPNTKFTPHFHSVTFNHRQSSSKPLSPTMSSLVLLILLCLSLHTCDACRLRLADKEHRKQAAYFSKDAERTKVLETTITSRSRPCPFDKCISKQKSVKYDGRNSHDKQKDSKVPFKKQENGEASGYENIIVSSFHKYLQLARSIQGLKRNVRSLLGAAQHDTAEETVDSIENEGVDNSASIVMDYAQPHWKPPIHNEKP